jgi:tripartite-type tricarboxylate transporter receptor subunit TctC
LPFSYSIKDLIALAKAKPTRINYFSAGHGSASHLIGELLKTRAQIEIV